MTMTTILFTLGIFAVALIGMAIGVIVSNRRIKGSCGGLANMRDPQGNIMCEGCSDPSPECQGEPLESSAVAKTTSAD